MNITYLRIKCLAKPYLSDMLQCYFSNLQYLPDTPRAVPSEVSDPNGLVSKHVLVNPGPANPNHHCELNAKIDIKMQLGSNLEHPQYPTLLDYEANNTPITPLCVDNDLERLHTIKFLEKILLILFNIIIGRKI